VDGRVSGLASGGQVVGTAEGVTTGGGADDAQGAGEAGAGDTGADAVVAGLAEGDGPSATRMPQPASSTAAPAAASTPARHLDLTSASSMLSGLFRRRPRHTLATAGV
jgi:hypothetical protein